MKMTQQILAQCLVAGAGQGEALVLAEPLSLWGGLNPETGEIIDQRHPQRGERVTGRVLVLPCGRGSSSASSILLEAVRLGTAPAAIITNEPDGILALGAVVARELYGQSPPVLVLTAAAYAHLHTGQHVTITEAGLVEIAAAT
jgi:predicted aconitase with swiveling domain